MQSPTGAEIWICQAELGGTHSQAELGNDKGGDKGDDRGGYFASIRASFFSGRVWAKRANTSMKAKANMTLPNRMPDK